MLSFGAVTLALALAGAGEGRLLLCRPHVAGDAALARGEAVVDAGRRSPRFLDYGVACEDAAEGARAARRAGLAYAVATTAEGRVEGSRYVLVLSDAATEVERARRVLEVAPGSDAVRPLRSALAALVGTLPPPPGPRPAHVAAWSIAGAGVAAMVAGAVVALQARGAADDMDSAGDAAAYTGARERWKQRRSWSAVGLGVGGAALAAGLTWRFVF
jgi:hypothetical protein